MELHGVMGGYGIPSNSNYMVDFFSIVEIFQCNFFKNLGLLMVDFVSWFFFSNSGFFSLLSSTSMNFSHGTLNFVVVCNPRGN